MLTGSNLINSIIYKVNVNDNITNIEYKIFARNEINYYVCIKETYSINNIKSKLMPGLNIDFGFKTNDVPKVENGNKEEEITPIDGNKDIIDLGDGNKTPKPQPQPQPQPKPDNKDDDPSTGELEVGTQVEFENNIYTVAENGDLVDKEGKVFKPANEVSDWLKALNIENDDEVPALSIDSIRQKLNIDITDELGKPMEFTNDPEGVAAYVNKVIELRSKDIEEGAINSLYEKMPIVKDFINYLVANGGDYRGFGELTDRSGIEVDENNVAQQEAIIRTAYEEFNRRGNVETYIKYLKDTNALFDTAKEELAALQEKDIEERRSIEERAEAARKAQIENTVKYWTNVKKIIDSRVISGYKLPESLVINKNGQKLTVTPNDFYNYISRTDSKTGVTAYQSDLDAMSDEEVMNADILDAWLHFTGGSYKDLVDMAIKEEQVKKLILRAKENKTTKTIRINPPKGKTNMNDIVL